MKNIQHPGKVVFICDGKKCSNYSRAIRRGFKEAIRENGLKNDVAVVRMDCTDNCKCAPVICLQPHNIWIGEVTEYAVPALVEEFLMKDN